jgi:hypothetical protein
MTVLEANHDPELIPEVIRLLETHTLSDVASRPMIQELFRLLLARHQHNPGRGSQQGDHRAGVSSSTSPTRGWTR